MNVNVRLRELNSVFNVIYMLNPGKIIAIMHLADSFVIIKPAVNTTSCRAGKAWLFVILQLEEILEKTVKDVYVPLRNQSSSLGDAQFELRAPGLWGTRTLLVLSLFTDLSTRQNLLWCKMSTRSLEYSSDKQERKTLLRPFHRTKLRLRLSRKETTTKGKATVDF